MIDLNRKSGIINPKRCFGTLSLNNSSTIQQILRVWKFHESGTGMELVICGIRIQDGVVVMEVERGRDEGLAVPEK